MSKICLIIGNTGYFHLVEVGPDFQSKMDLDKGFQSPEDIVNDLS